MVFLSSNRLANMFNKEVLPAPEKPKIAVNYLLSQSPVKLLKIILGEFFLFLGSN
jgi:hypothetical protein